MTTPATEQEAIAQALEMSGGLVSFEGQNCNDWLEGESCGGWDGVSRRCECGNRRVSWEFSRLVDGELIADAVAW